MSTAEQPVYSPNTLTVCTDVPPSLTLKTKLREADAAETWDAFDRIKKRKYIFKRFKNLALPDPTEPFKNGIAHWEQIRTAVPALPAAVMLGQDDSGVWYVRETAAGQVLAELASAGKPMKEHEAARRITAAAGIVAKLHQQNFFHGNLKPGNIFFTGLDEAAVADPCFGNFRSGQTDLSLFGSTDFLPPEQQTGKTGTPPPNNTAAAAATAAADIWSLAALLAYCLTGSPPPQLNPEQIPETFRTLIAAAMQENPDARPASVVQFRSSLEQLVKATRPSTFAAAPAGVVGSVAVPSPATAPATATAASSLAASPAISSPANSSPAMPASEMPPAGTVCPQCKTPMRNIADRNCPQCGRSYYEPCLNCQSLNPFWIRNCRGCNSDLSALKQQLFANLNQQKQQILKYRESYGHDKTLPLLKYMTTVNHPDFAAFKEWAKSMNLLIQKERRDIKSYVDGIRAQTNAAMESQKYDRVQQILEQVPRPLLDEQLRQQYVTAGDALTEVDSLIKEIKNAISTKQYSQLLSCVQRYLELKANDPEAQNLQRRIEKLTTMTTAKGMKMRRIPGGRFYMGSHDSDEYLRNNEHPQHKVIIPHNLFVGVYLVTQKQFMELMEFNPSIAVTNEDCPADGVTWYSAVEFCNKMSEAESLPPYYDLKAVRRRQNGSIEGANVKVLGGDGYRLLTEAEWEYACRAGSITPWCFGDQVLEVGIYAWYYDNSQMESHPVGQRKPNSWGLYDMHGNVMEWCHDWYNESFYQQCPEEEENPSGPAEGVSKVLRGGAWQFGAEATRCAYRNSSPPDAVAGVIGFRVCRNAGDEAM